MANRRLLEKNNTDQRGRVAKCASGLDTAGDLFGLIAELVAADRSFGWSSPWGAGEQSAADKAFWGAFGIDRAALIAGAKSQAKEKKDARKVGVKLLAKGKSKRKAVVR